MSQDTLFDAHGVPTRCPKCQIPWQEERTIVEALEATGHYATKQAALAAAQNYGDPYGHFGANMVAVTDIRSDRCVHYRCTKCNHIVPR